VRGNDGQADVTLDAVTVLSNGKPARQFYEVEAELKDGDEKELRRIEKTLRKAGAQDSRGPKVFQALGLAFPIPELPISPALPPIEDVKILLKTHLKHLMAHEVGTRLGSEPEDLHQTRVATRRLRAYLRAALPMLSCDWAESIRTELSWLGSKLGPLRDLDVLVAHLRSERPRLRPPERRRLKGLLETLEQERPVRREALVRAMESDRYLCLLERIETAANSPVVTNPDVSLAKIAGSAFKKVCRAMRNCGKDASDAELHRIRIKGKRTRYAAELAEAVVGKRATRFIYRLKTFQDLLGEHHDALVAEERLRKLLAIPCDPKMAFLLGHLIERQHERRREARRALPKVWKKVKKCGQQVWG
jgi:CHAD domain-containing protein